MVTRRTTMLHLIKDTATVGAMFATGVIIDEKSLLPVGSLLTICGLVWWLGRKLQNVDDRLLSIEKSVDGLECVKHKICPKEESNKLKML